MYAVQVYRALVLALSLGILTQAEWAAGQVPASASAQTSTQTKPPVFIDPLVSVELEREPGLPPSLQKLLGVLPETVQHSVLVMDVDTGKVLAALKPDHPRIPASTMKMVIAAAILADRGGQDAWWSTELTVPAGEVGQSEVSELIISGSGDPTLSAANGSNSLQALAQQVKAAGITTVGQIKLNTSGLKAGHFKENTVLGLPMPAVRLVEWEKSPPQTAQEAQDRLGKTLIYQLKKAGVMVTLPEIGQAAAYKPYVPEPRQDEEGNPLPPDPLIPLQYRQPQGVASVRSGAPTKFLYSVLRPSHNLRAEALLATLALRTGADGTLKSALSEAKTILDQRHIDTSDITLADGSGLSRKNRLTARFLGDLLKRMYDLPYLVDAIQIEGSDFPSEWYKKRQNIFVESLAQAGTGEDVKNYGGRGGTLAKRLVNSGLDVRAKTGTLPGVSALAGYLTTKKGQHLAFVILMNGPNTSPILEMRAVQDRMLKEMAKVF